MDHGARYWLPYVATEHGGITGSEPDERQDELIRQYVAYFDTIKETLPPDVLLFGDRKQATLSLHDSEVRAIRTDFAARTVTIQLEGEAREPGPRYRVFGSRLFTLRYADVRDWDYRGKDCGLEGLDGDHLFDEIQRLPDGLIQHRMYFSGEIEITVRFRGFSLDYQDTPYAPP